MPGETRQRPARQRARTPRKRAAATDASEALFRVAADHAREGIVVLDGRGVVVAANRRLGRWCEEWGWDRVTPGQPLSTASPALAAALKPQIFAASRKGRPERAETAVRANGSKRTLDVHCVPVTLRGHARQTIVILTDVTDARRMEHDILEASVREKRRIGQDLHDTVGQHLTAILYLVASVRRELTTHGLPLPEDLAQIASVSTTALAQARQLARGLSPVDLCGDDLESALRRMADGVQRLFGIPCHCRCGDGAPIGGDTALHLYGIAHEAVFNAIRHAKPTAITVALSLNHTHGALRVRDNGSGLPPGGDGGTGMGICCMRFRARTLGGTLALRSAPGGGPTVACRFPRPK